MTISEWQDLKPRIFRDFPNLTWVENVKYRWEHGGNCGMDEDPMCDNVGNVISFPWGDFSPLNEIFGICGCGMPKEVVKKFYYPFLKAMKAEHDFNMSHSLKEIRERQDKEKENRDEKKPFTYWNIVDDIVLEHLILYALDNLKLTEHGTSVCCSFLSQKGETALMLCDAILGENNV